MTDASSKTLAAVWLYAGSLPVLCSSVNASLGTLCAAVAAAAVTAVADVFFFCLLLRLYFLLPRPCAILLLRFSSLVADGTLHSRWWWCVLGSLSLSLARCFNNSEPKTFFYTCTLTMGFAGARSHTVALHIICSGRLAAATEIAVSTLWNPLHSRCCHFFSSFRLAYLRTLTHSFRGKKTSRIFFLSLYLMILIRFICFYWFVAWFDFDTNFGRVVLARQDCAWKGWIDQ